MDMKIGVIGAGSWGTALAQLLAGNGHNVGPVSYTHLDVYKRQILYSLRKSNARRNSSALFFCRIPVLL